MHTHTQSRLAIERQRLVTSDIRLNRTSAKLYNRDLKEFRYLLASWNERCIHYEYAYNREVQQSSQIVKAYWLLTYQYERVVDDLAVNASRCLSLQKDIEDMQTEILAHDAVMEDYAQQLAAQPVNNYIPQEVNKALIRRIHRLEEDLSSTQHALLSAREMLGSSAEKTR
jgi:hypothetical protein